MLPGGRNATWFAPFASHFFTSANRMHHRPLEQLRSEEVLRTSDVPPSPNRRRARHWSAGSGAVVAPAIAHGATGIQGAPSFAEPAGPVVAT
jgi:hypothetical protein